MVSPALPGNELTRGMNLTLEECLRRWESIPGLRRAELIDGVVYVPSPVGIDHCTKNTKLIGWLDRYAEDTPGCEAGNNGGPRKTKPDCTKALPNLPLRFAFRPPAWNLDRSSHFTSGQEFWST